MTPGTTPTPLECREYRRLRAYELKEQGWKQKDIAAALGVTEGAVSQWLKRAREEGGRGALRRRTRRGNPHLRAALVEAAQAAGHTKATYLAAQFHRLAARRGRKKAVIAVAHSILVIAYHLLARGTTYQDLGVHYFDERDRRAVERRAVRRLVGLGFKVILEPAA